MLARIHRLVIFSTLLCASAWLLALWAFSKPAALLAFFMTLFFYSVVLAGQCLALRWINRPDPVPQASAAQLLRAWWSETWVAARVFFWWQPFRAKAWPDQIPAGPGAAQARGVVLVHGFICNRALWFKWFPILRSRAIPHLAVTLEPVFGSIDAYVPVLEQAVDRLRQATGLAPLVVCHSMGGLAVRAWLRAGADPGRVHHVVTIASPHHGTLVNRPLPRQPWLVNGEQMRYGSDWLAMLAQRESVSCLQKFTCFYSNCDNIVMPASSATLDHAQNRLVPGVPHVALALDRTVIEQTLALL